MLFGYQNGHLKSSFSTMLEDIGRLFYLLISSKQHNVTVGVISKLGESLKYLKFLKNM